MADEEALIGETAGQLEQVLGPIVEGLDKARRRFVTQIVGAMAPGGR